MADEASMADETSIVSSLIEDGTSKEHETLMETETFNSDSMVLERQIDITSPCTKDAWVEAEQSELIGLKVDSENDAYEAYRRYSFIKCFGIRHSNLRKTNKCDVIGREFCCFEQGTKAKKGVVGKNYTKLDRRTHHYKAMVHFKIIDGKYDGIRLVDGVRSLAKEAGGSAVVGFEYGDAATAIKKAGKKKFDVTDCNTLINILKQRAASEEDFYYDFELDENNALVSVFFRDKIMRQDYEAYYELLGNDGTYCTNKYDMICAPFVGINNHTRICLFGIGFMLNERTESFEWLYGTFLKSMGGIQPKTIMTDQSKAMSNAIKVCFPHSKHRLCVWHLFKNSAAHLGRLKESLGFNKLFSRILKRCHTEEELNHCWNRYLQ
ncbi:protein FAR1-RELATED SEQUENCE 5-like [Silene latifolia]|uniref:protein FAR1-RELATED SEQUENCE 5-like n=1 Tax=Silene latifolia TaxID=37657 RepID=UPI003D773701